MEGDERPDESVAGVEYRQVSFVALAAIALVLAGLFAPGVQSGLDWDGDIETEEPAAPGCTIRLSDEPVPGSEITAVIHSKGEPVGDTPVWFNDDRVGETDELGRVSGEVPYESELVVRVGVDDECEAVEPTGRSSVASLALSDGGSEVESQSATGPGEAVRLDAPGTATLDSTDNASVEYDVDGEVAIGARDEPYPGTEIAIEAAIDGVPMRQADVTVDGETVGRTDDDGVATVPVPDDGSEQFVVGVARGDFDGEAVVDVLLLEVTLRSDGLAPIPGSDGTALVELGGEPVEGADVTVDGDYRGTTGPDGTIALELPRDPTTTVTASARDQTASTSLGGAYGTVALLLTLLVGGTIGIAHWRGGARGSATVVALSVGAVLVLILEAFYGTDVALAVLVALSVAAIGIAAVRTDRRVDVEVPSTRETTGGLFDRFVARVLGVVRLLESVLDRLRALLESLRARVAAVPRSPAELFGELGSLLADRAAELASEVVSLPGRTAAFLRRSRRVVIGTLAGFGLVTGAYVVGGWRWAAGAVIALGIAAAFALRRRRVTPSEAPDEESSRSSSDSSVEPTEHTDSRTRDERPSFRELWRSFARTVEPRRWRTRAPGEIERRALERGYPSEPVRELTTLFRDVEYGGRPSSDRVRERAIDAYEELAAETPELAAAGASERTDGGEDERDEGGDERAAGGEDERDEGGDGSGTSETEGTER